MAEKVIDKPKTIQNIIDWANRSRYHSIDIKGFNEKVNAADGEKFLKEAAEFCGVEVVYMD